MKHSIALKFIAILLCAVSLVAAAGSALGILTAEEFGLYSNTPDAWRHNQIWSIGSTIASDVSRLYAAEHLGNCPPEVLDALRETGIDEIYDYSGNRITEDMWSATIVQDGNVLVQGDTTLENAAVLTYDIQVWYPMVGDETGAAAYDAAGETVLEPEWSEYLVVEDGYNQMRTIYLEYYMGPEYSVTLYLQTENLATRYDTLVSIAYQFRYAFIGLLLAGLLLAAVCLVYLCWAAGRKSGTAEIVPGGLNRIPLDLHALCSAGVIFLLCIPAAYVLDYMSVSIDAWGNLWICLGLCALCGLGIALVVTGFVMAFAAQVKVKAGYWWRHSVCGWCLRQIGRFLRWVGRGFAFFARGCRAVFRLLPVIWQWLLTAFLMVFAVVISFLLSINTWGFWNFFWGVVFFASLFGCVAIVCYGGYCFGILLKGAKVMAQGDLNQKINTKYLLGVFHDFAVQLNNLAGAAQIAAERQMKSERMKTELITNVSHDIKTPLTSIINYVDLLKKPHSEAEGGLYLEVLDRQSQRLKKLIDDLMEMSKASTGNLSVEIGRVDAVEAVNQALGEFADKLASVNLIPIFRYPDFPVVMQADGRLVWRVMSNLLSNAVKYAMPDTRLYIDLMVLQGNAVIAIKNISREQLNMGADELMERFVRGDSSRNTEGSGLGLNIAKSLVELQHGQMHLMVDGDLFKVTLIFPCS